jgi:anaerobic magnesium-protoporphyrin IX monomethyl ester cyclase
MMKKVMFISPNYGFTEIQPISLLTLATYLRQNNIHSLITDMGNNDSYYSSLEFYRPDVVALSSMTNNIDETYRIADELKKIGLFIVIGGVHASIFPEETLKHCNAVVVGDGEEALVDIVNNKTEGIIQGKKIENLDTIELPAYDLIEMEHYVKIRRKVYNSLFTYVLPFDYTLAILTSRGCAFKCSFCYNSMKDVTYRVRSPEKVIEEIKLLKDVYHIDSFHIHDDDFIVNKKRAEQICDYLKEDKINLYWSCNSRVSDVNENVLEMLRSAGCVQLAFGLESASQERLNDINKIVTVEQMDRAINLCDQYGFVSQGSFMIGTPHETLQDMYLTKNFAIEHNIDGGLGLAICTPYPGTKLWEWCKENKLIGDKIDWSTFKYDNLSVNMSNVSTSQLIQARDSITGLFNQTLFSRGNSRLRKVIEIKNLIKEGKLC